jgi:hypothetical protein
MLLRRNDGPCSDECHRKRCGAKGRSQQAQSADISHDNLVSEGGQPSKFRRQGR